MGSSKSERQFHFLLGSSSWNLMACAVRYGGVAPAKWFRFACILAFTMLGIIPRMWESLRHGRAIRKTKLVEPIFVIGHWQSGQSPMQFLLANDPQFGYLTLFQAAFPWVNLTSQRVLRPIVKRFTRGKTRGSDSYQLHLGLPQGTDLPMASGSDLSFYHAYVFSGHAEQAFRQSALFEGVSSRRVEKWKKLYRYLIQKIAYTHNTPRVLLRNATDTARVKALIEEFPDARFIHVCRNPYETVQATNERWAGMCKNWGFQAYDDDALRGHTLDFYERTMQQYFAQRELVPENQLVEVRYEDLQQRPLEILQEIYTRFEIPGFDEALPRFEQYLAGNHGSLAGHQELTLTPEEIHAIRDRLGFAFEALGYPSDPVPAAVAVHGE